MLERCTQMYAHVCKFLEDFFSAYCLYDDDDDNNDESEMEGKSKVCSRFERLVWTESAELPDASLRGPREGKQDQLRGRRDQKSGGEVRAICIGMQAPAPCHTPWPSVYIHTNANISFMYIHVHTLLLHTHIVYTTSIICVFYLLTRVKILYP